MWNGASDPLRVVEKNLSRGSFSHPCREKKSDLFYILCIWSNYSESWSNSINAPALFWQSYAPQHTRGCFINPILTAVWRVMPPHLRIVLFHALIGLPTLDWPLHAMQSFTCWLLHIKPCKGTNAPQPVLFWPIGNMNGVARFWFCLKLAFLLCLWQQRWTQKWNT